MTINVAVIGCGKRFREFYLNPLTRLQNENKIKVINLYNRNIKSNHDLRNIFDCNITDNLNEILLDKNVNLIVLTLPINLRKKLFLNNKFSPKYLLSETPFTNNLSQFYKYKKILKNKGVEFEIFEDKFFHDYPNLQNLNFKKIIIFNKLWEHHALSFFFKIAGKNLSKLENISYKEFRKLEIFKFDFGHIKFDYIFSKNKKDAIRKNGKIKFLDENKKIYEIRDFSHNQKNTGDLLYQCILNLTHLKKKEAMYSSSFLELENIIITLMKIIRKLKLKKINRLQINLIQKFMKLYSII
tara:strand:+ start:282 stop:1175 length:894 start_codon:yes stop_codon:yes gene_type:complete